MFVRPVSVGSFPIISKKAPESRLRDEQDTDEERQSCNAHYSGRAASLQKLNSRPDDAIQYDGQTRGRRPGFHGRDCNYGKNKDEAGSAARLRPASMETGERADRHGLTKNILLTENPAETRNLVPDAGGSDNKKHERSNRQQETKPGQEAHEFVASDLLDGPDQTNHKKKVLNCGAKGRPAIDRPSHRRQ